MRCDQLIIRTIFHVNYSAFQELNILADKYSGGSLELLIHSFITEFANIEKAYPHYQAERFLDKMIGDIRPLPIERVVSVDVTGKMVIVKVAIDSRVVEDWIDGN